MKFVVNCVRNCLLENRVVFTVRSYLYTNINDEFEGKEIRRFLMKKVESRDDLNDFVKLSGFDSVEEWWNKIEMFCTDKVKYLYLVEMEGK